MIFGAIPSKWTDWASIFAADRWKVGSVWVEEPPLTLPRSPRTPV